MNQWTRVNSNVWQSYRYELRRSSNPTLNTWHVYALGPIQRHINALTNLDAAKAYCDARDRSDIGAGL
jgi:hypothetical protein